MQQKRIIENTKWTFLRKVCFTLLTVNIITVSAFSQTNGTKTVAVEVKNVVANGGTVHISAFYSENAYKKRTPDCTFQVSATGGIVRTEIEFPLGDCLLYVYQDINKNGKCDNNIIGIPKEPVGITNWNGKGHPSSFSKYKVTIDKATTTININLYQLW
jgi:uncharacterized protein (DUF2141 family)